MFHSKFIGIENKTANKEKVAVVELSEIEKKLRILQTQHI